MITRNINLKCIFEIQNKQTNYKMRYLLILCFFIFFNGLNAQPDGVTDEIFQIVEEMPRFPGCEDMEGTTAEKEACAREKLLTFVYENVVYPDSALLKDIDGTVVLRFVVNKEGEIINDTLLKDIGGGCGEEALRVVKLMNEMPEKWTPGKQGNQPVDVYFTLPVKFKLKQPIIDPDFVFLDGDSIWVKYDEVADFEGGEEAYESYQTEHLEYPFIGNIDCLIGVIEVKILIRTDGSVKIMDITDFNNLGIHFWYETIDFIHKSAGSWKPAIYKGRAVNGTYDARITFLPTFKCTEIIENFKTATELVKEGIQLFEAEHIDQSIEKFAAAVELFPDNPEFLAFRGQALLQAERMEEACTDLTRVRELLYVPWYDSYLPFICK